MVHKSKRGRTVPRFCLGAQMPRSVQTARWTPDEQFQALLNVMTYPGFSDSLEHPAKPFRNSPGRVSRHGVGGHVCGRAGTTSGSAVLEQARVPSGNTFARELILKVGRVATEHFHGCLAVEGIVGNDGVLSGKSVGAKAADKMHPLGERCSGAARAVGPPTVPARG